MKISCYLQANSRRTQYLKQAIESVNKQDIFFEKHIHIYTPTQVDSSFYDLLYETGWHVSSGNVSRMASFKEMVAKIDADYIFYIEDDIELVHVPQDIYELLTIKDDKGRSCGLLSMNLGGSSLRYPYSFGDLPKLSQLLLSETPEYLMFLRKESLRNDFFFEFPCVFMNKELLKELLEREFTQGQIEMVLTYYYTYYMPRFYKASLCRPTLHDIVDKLNNYVPIENFDSKLEEVKFYNILDPNQGGINGTN